MRILMIDNDVVFSEPIIWRLEREKHDVTFVRSVEETRNVINNTFDIVILDIMMPRGPYTKAESDFGKRTGMLLLKEIELRHPQLPVVILTVIPKEELQPEVDKHKSVKAFLEKPVTPSEILTAIEKITIQTEEDKV